MEENEKRIHPSRIVKSERKDEYIICGDVYNSPMFKDMPPKEIKKVIEEYNKLVKEGKAICTLDHGDHRDNTDISLSKASHIIKKLTLLNSEIHANVKYLETDMGKLHIR